MKTRIVIKAWNDKPIFKEYSKEEYEKIVKAGWKLMISTLLSINNSDGDEFEIESVEVEE